MCVWFVYACLLLLLNTSGVTSSHNTRSRKVKTWQYFSSSLKLWGQNVKAKMDTGGDKRVSPILPKWYGSPSRNIDQPTPIWKWQLWLWMLLPFQSYALMLSCIKFNQALIHLIHLEQRDCFARTPVSIVAYYIVAYSFYLNHFS